VLLYFVLLALLYCSLQHRQGSSLGSSKLILADLKLLLLLLLLRAVRLLLQGLYFCFQRLDLIPHSLRTTYPVDAVNALIVLHWADMILAPQCPNLRKRGL
jgi:hypothetical protein